MTTPIRHLSHRNYLNMPWRNGLGSTLEIARASSAAADDEFQWRLSLATVAASGPFSHYPHYRRAVTLVNGSGFRLDIAEQASALLDTIGTTAMFAGAATTHCVLIGGVSTDLSLMVREPGDIVSVSCLRVDAMQLLALHRGTHNAVFCLQGEVALFQGEVALSCSDQPVIELETHDTALLPTQLATTHSAAVSVRAASSVPALVSLLSWRTTSAAI